MKKQKEVYLFTLNFSIFGQGRGAETAISMNNVNIRRSKNPYLFLQNIRKDFIFRLEGFMKETGYKNGTVYINFIIHSNFNIESQYTNFHFQSEASIEAYLDLFRDEEKLFKSDFYNSFLESFVEFKKRLKND